MLERLRQVHDDIEALLTEHERLTRTTIPDIAAIVATQLRLARLNRERKALIEQIYDLLQDQSAPARAHVDQLKEDDKLIRSHASKVIGDWPKDRIEREWAEYQKDGIAIRRWNRQRIALEQKLLYPLLASHQPG